MVAKSQTREGESEAVSKAVENAVNDEKMRVKHK